MALSSSTSQLTTTEAAARCGFDYRHWLKLRAAGQTPPPDAFEGRQARYSPESIDRWFAARGGKKSYRIGPAPIGETLHSGVVEVTAPIGDDIGELAA